MPASTAESRSHLEDVDRDGDLDLVAHFRCGDIHELRYHDLPGLQGLTDDGAYVTSGGTTATLFRPIQGGQDWSVGDGLRFWFHGTGKGDAIRFQLHDNRAPDAGPSSWRLVWSDEFNGPAGRKPDSRNWTHEIGDGTANGIPGWGNNELEYYTDDAQNAATNGRGQLAITARQSDGSLNCYYGPCQFTSARLISQHKAEFAYGRIETRIKVPAGAGLWPAFWSLGTNIADVGWPQTGEIDIMEFVGRVPNEIFGTIHGPGYSGGASFGGTHDFGVPVSDSFHTVSIEWQPNRIDWYVDGILYHSATPANVAPNQWVFNHPFFLILNMAIGGNFGGPLDPNVTFPQSFLVDYVRVYQGPDTAERFETTFVDDTPGWKEVSLPFPGFTRSGWQPKGAPNDGLTLSSVWGYGLVLPPSGLASGSLLLDKVRLIQPLELTVTNTNQSGAGSLSRAVEIIGNGGTIDFAAALAGQTITVAPGRPFIVNGKSVTIDAAAAPGLTLNGGGAERVFIVEGGSTATLRHLTITNGFGFDLAGGILNNGTVNLERCVVTGNAVGAVANDFWKGGGGIYSGRQQHTQRARQHSEQQPHDTGRRRRHLCVLQRRRAHRKQHGERQRRRQCRWRHSHARQCHDREQHAERQHVQRVVRWRVVPHRRSGEPRQLDGDRERRAGIRQRSAVRRHVHRRKRHAQHHQQHRRRKSRSRWQSRHGMFRRAVRQRSRDARLWRHQRVHRPNLCAGRQRPGRCNRGRRSAGRQWWPDADARTERVAARRSTQQIQRAVRRRISGASHGPRDPDAMWARWNSRCFDCSLATANKGESRVGLQDM